MARAAEGERAMSRRKPPEMAATAGFTARARVCVCSAREVLGKCSRERRGGG